MEHKPLVVVLVVVAVLVGVTVVRGRYRDRTDPPPQPNNPPGQWFKPLDRLLDGFRSPLDVKRIIGCGRTDRLLITPTECHAVIVPGSARVSRFTLTPWAGSKVEACFGLNLEQFDECLRRSGDNKPTELDAKGSRLMVGRDSAFLALYCRAHVGPGACQVSVE